MPTRLVRKREYDMREDLQLLPVPQSLDFQKDEFKIVDSRLIAISSANIQKSMDAAIRLKEALLKYAGHNWQIVAGTAVSSTQIGVHLAVEPGATKHTQGYQLTVTVGGIFITASTAAGLFYGVVTLIQILDHCGSVLPGLRINDWPDYPVRGVMLDISRNKVPKMETLYNLVELLASWKINQLQLYTEHTFAYWNHPVVWEHASPLTGEEILSLDAFCRERHIELVPNQNSFGHMRRWLTHPEYNHLAECPEGCDTEWGYFEEPFSLCPEDPGSLKLLCSLYDELLPHFSSKHFNIGCDETVDLGQGRSAQIVRERGAGRVYFDFLKKLTSEVMARNHKIQFWGDIIVKRPDLVAELPRNITALEWGYEADHPFDEHGQLFDRSGIPYYVCPGTSSWNSVGGRTENAVANLLNAAKNGMKHGAVGYLNTDWGDNGHWQPLPVSYIGFAYGAGLSWSLAANEHIDLAQVVSKYAFEDDSGQLGSIAYELGDVDHDTGGRLANATILFSLLQTPPGGLDGVREKLLSGKIQAGGLEAAQSRLTKIAEQLSSIKSENRRNSLILNELEWVTNLLKHACRRGIWMLNLEDDQEEEGASLELAQDAGRLIKTFKYIWHERNRPGGFNDSLALFNRMHADYEDHRYH